MLLSERYRTTKDERRGRFANTSYYDAENDEDVTGWRANALNTRSMYKQDRRVLKMIKAAMSRSDNVTERS